MSPSPAWSETDRWTLSDEPEIEIGVEAGDQEYMLSGVRAAVQLADGRIVLASADSFQLRFYDASGRHLQSVGRQGQGPGEFEYLWKVVRCVEDEIWAQVLPYALDRFDLDGGYLGSIRPTLPTGGPPYGVPACNRAGQLMVYGWEGRRDRDFFRMRTSAALFSRELEVEADFGEVPGSERWKSGPHPYGKQTALALSDDRAYIGTADEHEILEYTLGGTLVRRIRWQGDDLRLDSAEIDRFKDWAPAAEGEERGVRGDDIKILEFPERMPAYTDILLDPAGNLWVRGFAPPGVRRETWTVLSPDGVWLGSMSVNERFTVTEVGADYVLGVYRDELDTEFVRRYRLNRGSR